MMSSFSLQEYRIQREYRQNKRKQYLKRFEALKQKMPLDSFVPHPLAKIQQIQQKPQFIQHKKPVSQIPKSQPQHLQPSAEDLQLKRLLQQNNLLKEQLQSIEAEEKKKLMQFKEQISSIKEKYINEIKTISAQSQKAKSQSDEKLKKILDQMTNAVKKNEEIKKVNQEMRKQLAEGDSSIGAYTTEIKNEYSKKLNEFEKIFNTSNEKILEMEKQFNQEQFVDNALKNEQLLKTIQQNASKSEEAAKILEDYKQLLQGKDEILKQITSNIEMKQSELNKMGDLENKMKIIFEKMNEEKKTYISENQRMTKQLMEIKQLIMGFLSQAEGAQEAEQGEQ